jgi:hypothetical protein
MSYLVNFVDSVKMVLPFYKFFLSDRINRITRILFTASGRS